MFIDYSGWETFDYTVNTLQLDINNPRIKYNGIALNQTQIIKHLIEKENVYELAKKISEEGYFVGEEPIICIESDKKIVLEGNRRTAALKILQDPNKYLPRARAGILSQNILKNGFPIKNKLKCYIAPNRLLANPIIYSRHKGESLKRWETGNQYAFVSSMYYDDGLSIEDICDVLNESKSVVLKPLKAYNLFWEGKEILEKEKGIKIEIDKFKFTNLERFYTFDPASKFLGIDFDESNGELIIKIPRAEFEKRILEVFKRLIDSERFSREFDREDQKQKYINDLRSSPEIDLLVKEDSGLQQSHSSDARSNLEEKKQKVTSRRKHSIARAPINLLIIPRDTFLTFNHEKLDDLFEELKSLPIEKTYSFAILLRTLLEQTLSYYIEKKSLSDIVNAKSNEDRKKEGEAKVNTLIAHLRGKYNLKGEIDKDPILNILKFSVDKMYSSSLKTMLDYVKNHELVKFNLDPSLLTNIGQYFDLIKKDLDLAVHNLNFAIDIGHNRRAWKHLFPFLEILSNELSK